MGVRRAAIRRSAIAAGLAALTVGLIAPPASADGQAPAREVAPAGAEAAGVDHELSGLLLLDGNLTKLVNLSAVTQVVDSLGRAIGSPQSLRLRASGDVSTPELGEYSCVYRGKGNKKFRPLLPVDLYRDYGYGKVQAQFHTYKLSHARVLGGAKDVKSTQFEVCGVGGGDMGDKRMRRVGLGIGYPDAATTHKIGSEWRSGEVPENYTVELGFEAPVYKDITISGGISQTPTNKLMGSFEPPFPTALSPFARNAVNAWWQDDCVGGIPCNRYQGSKDFHGTVAQGLFEFTPDQLKTFRGFVVSTFLSTN